VPEWSGRGRQAAPPFCKSQCAGQRVDQWIAAQTADAWQRLTFGEGEKGLLVADYLHAHVWVWDGEEGKARCWHLLVRREVGADSISHYCLSNAPLDTPWQELARVQAQRFFIEHSFREAKSECGITDYQVRRWDA
jgi:SRSO17 transposase